VQDNKNNDDDVTDVGTDPGEVLAQDEQGTPQGDPSREDIERLEKERDEMKDKYLRSYADFENYRKRVTRDKEEILKFGNEKLLLEILTIKDDLERALEHKESADADSLQEGLILIQRDLEKILTHHKVKQVNAVGQVFDPRIHEALGEEESKDQAPGTVIKQFQAGYLFHGRLLRPARVIVSKKSAVPREDVS
jgi:molecular chaperone GrpE